MGEGDEGCAVLTNRAYIFLRTLRKFSETTLLFEGAAKRALSNTITQRCQIDCSGASPITSLQLQRDSPKNLLFILCLSESRNRF